MQRMAILALAVLITVLVVIQLALPPLLAGQVEKQLTKHGGHASVELEAFPSPRLLFREGDSLTVKATGLVTPPADPTSKGTLSDLDGFDEVDIQVVGMHVGPLTVARLTLTRKDGSEAYEARVQATVTAAALSTYAGGQIGGGLGGFLGGIAGSAMPGASVEIPIDLDATLRSEEGAIRAVRVNGSVAGLPAGPFVEALLAALAGRF
ncbi:MAG: hypothetical protein QOJ57_1379 [Thermoleophilaceae bacterium]|jgi:hypothetical protein|nr:hypothetical protein [Thermoleophilaceae bacterium]